MQRPLFAATRLMRPRITERLTRATRFPITLVAAPAGFGKSVALSDFIATARLDVLRYDVGRGDGTLLAFVRRMSATVQPVAPSALAAFPTVQQRVLATRDPARELADWFVEHVKRAVCTIVVDDLHYASAEALAFLVAVIERTCERIAWILATRSDAGLPVASWIGYGRMDIPIGEDDLRFTADEAVAAAAEVEADLDADEIEALRELTGGWPIALAIALRARTYSANLRSAASGTREMVYRYLAEQVFTGLTRAQQRFLLTSCVFPSFDLALAEQLGANPAFLEELRRDATFLSEITPGVYRYHDLFREFLERELRRCGAAEWFRIHRDGAALLEARGDDAGALALLGAAGATEGIVAILARSGFTLVEHGEADLVSAALDAIPQPQRRENATLLGLGAMLDAIRGRFDLAEPGFVAAIARAQETELRFALVGRYAIELVRHDRDCVALLEPYAKDESVPLPLRIPILGTLATAYVSVGRIDDALETIRATLERLDAVGDEVRARIYQQAAYVRQFVRGREDARLFATRAAELALSCGLYELAARAYSILYTVVYDEEDDPIAVLAVLDKLGEYARKGASRQARLFGVIAEYEMEAERGDEAALARLERDLEGCEDALPLTATETLRPARALRAAWSGAFQNAYALLAGTAEQQRSDERRALRHAEIALYAFAAGRQDNGEAAAASATAALRSARPGRRVVRSHLILALALLAAGKAHAAQRHLVEAEGLLGPEMRRMRALAHVVRALYRAQLGAEDPAVLAGALERLRAEHGGGIARLVTAIPFVAEQNPFALLTPAERAILTLLVHGASTKEVAARTKRSPQTVDTHIRSICRKLNCSGRREAVALAIGAGLVDAQPAPAT